MDLYSLTALPDQADETALHESLAAHALPKGRAGLGLGRAGAPGRSVDGDPHCQAALAWSDCEEFGIGVNIEEDGVLSDGVTAILSASLLEQLAELRAPALVLEISEYVLSRCSEGCPIVTSAWRVDIRREGLT